MLDNKLSKKFSYKTYWTNVKIMNIETFEKLMIFDTHTAQISFLD